VRAGNWNPALTLGESVAVQGICLTVAAVASETVVFDVLEETLARTNLSAKPSGALLNLERALRVGDALGGHLVTGHVDATGTVRWIRSVGRDREVRIACAAEWLAGMVPKGSVALDGVSLTIVDLNADSFSVHIIPHTWQATSFSRLAVGDAVNIETDILGKYVARYLQKGHNGTGLTMEAIQKAGFI